MKYNGDLRALSFWYPASSLYSLIADGNYRPTKLGRNTWKGLISGSSLQRNCNKEGFNARITHHDEYGWPRARIGIIANQENDCDTPDSFLGLGTYSFNVCQYRNALNTAGNLAQCTPDNGNKNIKAMGYILVR